MNQFIIAYDVTTAKSQRKSCKLCRAHSHSYQKSAFEIRQTQQEINTLTEEIEEHLNNEDQLLIAQVATGSDILRIGQQGQLRTNENGLFWFG